MWRVVASLCAPIVSTEWIIAKSSAGSHLLPIQCMIKQEGRWAETTCMFMETNRKRGRSHHVTIAMVYPNMAIQYFASAAQKRAASRQSPRIC